MIPLEETIGYQFKDPLLLEEALTHPSISGAKKGGQFDNQRLEFLGDSVIGLVITEELFSRLGEEPEGTLTKYRAAIVSEAGLAPCARRLGLGDHLRMGKGEETSGGRKRPAALADAFEALVGALYLDGGFQAARDFALRHCAEEIQSAIDAPEDPNPKGNLQEILQGTGKHGAPSYRITSASGPDHCKVYNAEVHWAGEKLGEGRGSTKQAAEIASAADALTSERVAEIRPRKAPK